MKKKYLDPESQKSDKKGLWGIIERAFRTFRKLTFFLVIAPIALLYIIALSASLYPCLLFLWEVYSWSLSRSAYEIVAIFSVAIPCAYLMFALTIILVVPAINFIFPLKLKPMRCTWYSLEVIPWYYHNALVQLVRYTVLDILTPTPFNILFFRLMGMKIGKNVMINSTNISDPCMITLEDNVTIGGSATLFAHYGMKGFLIVEETVIKKGVTIGLKASVMGDVVVEENVMVKPHEVLLPKTRLKDDSDSEAS